MTGVRLRYNDPIRRASEALSDLNVLAAICALTEQSLITSGREAAR